MTIEAAGPLDTNVVINLPCLGDSSALPDVPLICTITLAKLSVGSLVAASEPERAKRQVVLRRVKADFDPLPFDAAAARAFGRVAADLRQAGRKRQAHAYDALIAAVALARNLPVHTGNPADFEGIGNLRVVAIPITA